ncbi:MAG TPA: hypothetical protein ENF62_00905 [Candidatus Bathyarchaeota archaeon]|nr:hypothetical protein [Candidatus Bathyarchaeota archaeon]
MSLQSVSMRVFRAVSSPIRMQILLLLYHGGAMSYTEIMKSLRLSPDRDAGKFAYHLKRLLQANLIKPDSGNGSYVITDLGRLVVNMAQGVGERASKRRRMRVRTSRLTIEEFDRNKIVDSLVREAGVPMEMACHIAKEAEERLIVFRTKYLTAPLIRELVNAILLEKGLEEYRHKLTRLGLPVYDVTALMRALGAKSMSVGAVQRVAGSRVLGEYALLNVLHRDVADAHLSGTLHIGDLGSWTLKIREVSHDLRTYLAHGVDFSGVDVDGASLPPPKSLPSALLLCLSLVRTSANEANGHILDYFNVFLAPYVRNLEKSEVKRAIRDFILDLNHSPREDGSLIPLTIGLEPLVPEFLADVKSVGEGGKKGGVYLDYAEESLLLAEAFLEVLEEWRGKPPFNPAIVVKVRDESFEEAEELLLLAHRLAASYGLPYFALLRGVGGASYSASGFRAFPEWTGDWELDTLRISELDRIALNLPRAVYEAGGDAERFFDVLGEWVELALRALMVKRKHVGSLSSQGLFPALTRRINGESYLRLANSPCTLSLIGLNEAVEALTGLQIHEGGEAEKLAFDILGELGSRIQAYSRRAKARFGLRLSPDFQAALRLARLDVERFGWSKVCVRGSREHPRYTSLTAIPMEAEVDWRGRLRLEGEFHSLTKGGHLALLQLEDVEQGAENLLSATRWAFEKTAVGLLAYTRNLTYCSKCGKTYYGLRLKCPKCGLMETITRFSRVSTKYAPLTRWEGAEEAVRSRVRYRVRGEKH